MPLETIVAYVIAFGVPVLAILVIYVLDLFKTTNLRTLLLCFAWGAIGAFGLAFVINNAVAGVVGVALVIGLTAPIVEEFLKSAILVYLIRQPTFRYFVDGAVYGFAAGIGFAVLENIYYINSREGGLSLAVSRVLSTSLMHGMASAVIGISLGRLRRINAATSAIVPVVGIAIAIIVHIIFNNLVRALEGPVLLLVAVGIGIGGAAMIAWQINAGLRREKSTFDETLTLKVDVGTGASKAVQRYGGEAIEDTLDTLRQQFGDENISLIRRMLIEQANIGILQNNLANVNVSTRLREAWEAEVAERKAEVFRIRQDLGSIADEFLDQFFPSGDPALAELLQSQMAEYDPTMVHKFDVLMYKTGLAGTLTPEQLVEYAERLHRIDIFKTMSLADLENLARAIEFGTYEDNTLLFDQGDAGDVMYLIESGGISIYSVDEHGTQNLIRTFAPGSVVGDFAVLDGQPRSARARAHGRLSVVLLKKYLFDYFVQSRPQVIFAVLQVLSEKARFTTTEVQKNIERASQIAQGQYAEVVKQAQPALIAVADDDDDVEVSEVSDSVSSRLNKAFAQFAASLQRSEESLGDART